MERTDAAAGAGEAASLRTRVAELERALDESTRQQARLRTIIDLCPDYIFANDLDGRVLLCNKAIALLYGTTVEEALGASYLDLDPDRAQAEQMLRLDAEVSASGQPLLIPEFEATDVHGRELVMDLRIIPYDDPASGEPAVCGVATDITAAREAARELEAARAQLQDAVESIGDGFLLFDRDDHLIMKNTRMLELVSDREDLFEIGVSFEETIRALHARGHYRRIVGVEHEDRESLIQARLALHREVPSVHEQEFPGGRWFMVSTRATRDGGRVVAYTDITGQKQREALEREKARIDRELEIARRIQQALLPRSPPVLDGFEIAGRNEPADHTGGDYYDWLTLPDGRVLVTLADVVGHGLGPAILVAVCRAYFRSCSSIAESAAVVVSRVNELLADDLTEGRFITAVVALVDPRGGAVEIYSAGQAPILHVDRSRGAVSALPADDVPLGLMSHVPAGCARPLELAQGDSLVLLTDGLYEWVDEAGDAFGLERLERELIEHSHEPAAEMVDSLFASARRFAGGRAQTDDVTAVVVRRR